jgi:hypothetical protein
MSGLVVLPSLGSDHNLVSLSRQEVHLCVMNQATPESGIVKAKKKGGGNCHHLSALVSSIAAIAVFPG